MGPHPDDTQSEGYTRRLVTLEGASWKRLLNVQAPYRWNLRRLGLGDTLDVGCGIGRNLAHLAAGSVGIDHNAESIRIARERGLVAFEPSQFHRSEYARPARFESLLLAHVIEHMPHDAAVDLVQTYEPYVRPAGKLVVVTPQEAGHRSDASHVRYADFEAIGRLCAAVGARVVRQYSFPFPRAVGRLFTYNEFVVVASLPG